jgi:D-alanyl-D-alanine carboxypeptidase/D-alanyl-D-alanine-endopeptidase (penicillin-binding protein 4)
VAFAVGGLPSAATAATAAPRTRGNQTATTTPSVPPSSATSTKPPRATSSTRSTGPIGTTTTSTISTGTVTTSTSSTVPPTTTTTPAEAQAAAMALLSSQLDAVMDANNGCLVVQVGSKTIYSHNAGVPLDGASTQKLLIAAAALSRLGPDYRFVTKVVASSKPVDGAVANLWLVGGGDPVLATPAFAASFPTGVFETNSQPSSADYPFTSLGTLAAEVKSAGITVVPGGVHGDDSRFDQVRFVPSWPLLYQTEHDISPLSALTLNEGYQAWTTTAVVPSDPPAFAATDFSQLLAAEGVNAPGASDSTAPASGVLVAKIYSQPLKEIVSAMLRASDNQIAELLVKSLGRVVVGVGSTQAGIYSELAADRKLGIDITGVSLNDASGLDHGDRTTCQAELGALDQGDRPRLSALLTGLAVAGESGTLAARFVGTPLAGHLIAKTGTVDDAGGIVGQIDLGTTVRFALEINQDMADYVLYNAEDEVATLLGTYSASPLAAARP